MSDHKSVQETEVAVAGKVSEGIEALRRLAFQERRAEEKQAGKTEQKKANQTEEKEPDKAVEKKADLEANFYRVYRESGVDKTTARAAARDAAIGLGSKDSPNVAKAEAQAVDSARGQAKEYRKATQTSANIHTPEAERQQATTRKTQIEQNLGIHKKSREVKAQTINGLDPQPAPQTQQAKIHLPAAERKPLLPKQEALKATYQQKLERGGVSPQTAEPASYDLASGKGAKDSQYVAIAQQELQRHHLLKNLYQSVYEKHRVSPEVAAIAADQLARGNGINRSPEVRQAHEQALANSQQISLASSVKPGRSLEIASERPATASKTEGQKVTLEVGQQGEKPVTQQATPDEIWARFSSGENGVFEAMAKGNPAMRRMSDQSIAKDALLAGHAPVDVQKAIALNSSHAQTLEYPQDYARTIVKKAEASPEVNKKRTKEQGEAQSNEKAERPSRKSAQKKQQASQKDISQRKGRVHKKVKTQDRGISY